VDFHSAGTLPQIWAALHRLVSYAMLFIEGLGCEDLVQPGALPTPRILVPLAVVILLMRWWRVGPEAFSG